MVAATTRAVTANPARREHPSDSSAQEGGWRAAGTTGARSSDRRPERPGRGAPDRQDLIVITVRSVVWPKLSVSTITVTDAWPTCAPFGIVVVNDAPPLL